MPDVSIEFLGDEPPFPRRSGDAYLGYRLPATTFEDSTSVAALEIWVKNPRPERDEDTWGMECDSIHLADGTHETTPDQDDQIDAWWDEVVDDLWEVWNAGR